MPIRICPHCGELVDDERTNVPYCKPCDAARHRAYRKLRRQATIGDWVKDAQSASPDRMRMLCAAIVDKLGGYQKVANEFSEYLQRTRDKAPKQATRAYLALLRLMKQCHAE